MKRRFAQTASPRRQDARTHEPRAVGVAESTAVSADLDASPSRCLREDHARDDAALSDASLPAGDLPEACLPEGRARDGAARSDASLPAGQTPEACLPEVLGTDADVVHEPRSLARSRYVPRDVLREVYARDAGRCSYVSADGRRCSARGFLEVHHHVAFARGGRETVDNLRLACRAHNFWLAERELGKVFIQGKLKQAARANVGEHPGGAR
jgi:hypothetical protein